MKKMFSLLMAAALVGLLPTGSLAQQLMKHAVVHYPQTRAVRLEITPRLQLRKDSATGLAVLNLEEGFASMERGAPDLPHYSHAFVGGDSLVTEVRCGSYHDVAGVELAPSKGPVSRLLDPRSVPAVLGPAYRDDKFYPERLCTWSPAYEVRGLRGLSLSITPVQYNPVRKILRVYQALTVSVYTTAVRPARAPGGEWRELLRSRFLNWNAVQESAGAASKPSGYSPASEAGTLLIVAPGRYHAALQGFRNWKAARGIRSWLVDPDGLPGGASPAAIKAAIAAQHSLHGVDFVLFVGSPQEVPVVSDPGAVAGPSYTAYGYLSGNDHYPDLLTGVFSVNNEQQLQSMVERSIRYEREPEPDGAWYTRGLGIASEQGPGDDNEMDYEHMRNLRSELVQSGYTAIGEYYDGTQGGLDAPGDPAPADIVAGINGGAGLMNYCGHGWEAGLGTSGFSVQHLPQLTNSGAWPFLMTVACNTGDFTHSECLGQAITRKTGSNGATGAVAAFCSSISQYWNQPMEAQDEVTKIVAGTGARVHSIGAITACGVMQMNDAYGASGGDMTDAWILFGDPSLQLRTRKPEALQVSHASLIDRSATAFTVSVADNVPATVALLYHDTLLSVAHRAATAPLTQHSFAALPEGDSFQVWVTAPDARPYSAWVRVAAKTGLDSGLPGGWAVYPQPAGERFRIRGAGSGAYALYDAGGRKAVSGTLCNGEATVQVSSLPAGTYVLEVQTSAGPRLRLPVQVAR